MPADSSSRPTLGTDPMPTHNLLTLCLLVPTCLLAWLASENTSPGRRFGEVARQISRRYLEPVAEEEIFEAAMAGVVARLDPHSDFLQGIAQRELASAIEQSFGGVGLELAGGGPREPLLVRSPVHGSPAWRAGIRAGDSIERIDGVSTDVLSLQQAVDRLRGEPGTTVNVRVASLSPARDVPAAAGTTRDLQLVREPVVIESVRGDVRRSDGSWNWMVEAEDGIAHLRITSFGDRTRLQLEQAIDEVEAQNSLRGVVLDLRGNGGGAVQAAIDVCDLFLDAGTIVTIRGRRSAANHPAVDDEVRRATPGSRLIGIPLAILVDGLSASAAEIVAACLQDHGRAIVVGSPSFGKGTVQSLLPLTEGPGILKLTTAEYLRPSGIPLDRGTTDADRTWGVVPDDGYTVIPTGQQLERWLIWRQDRDQVPREVSAGVAAPSAALPRQADPVLASALNGLVDHP
jgi:carboxyl-terminal processing protease